MQSSSQIVAISKPTPRFFKDQMPALPVAQPTVSKHCRERLLYSRVWSQVAAVNLEHMHSNGRYSHNLPSLARSLMHHLHLNESDVFVNRVRLHMRDVRFSFHLTAVISCASKIVLRLTAWGTGIRGLMRVTAIPKVLQGNTATPKVSRSL